MEIKNYIACEGILGVSTNSKYIGWSFGQPRQEVTEEVIDKCKVRVSFLVNSLKEQSRSLEGLQKYHYWRGRLGKDELFYQRNFFLGSKLRLLLRGLNSSKPALLTNGNYLRFIRFRFNNLHSPGYHLTDLVCALLLQKSLSPLHCSAFTLNNGTVAVIGPPDTGKTLTTMRAVFDAKASFLSEDLGITDGEYFYPCPWTSTFRYYDELSMSWLSRLHMRAIKVFPPAEFLSVPGESRTIDRYIATDRIGTQNKLTHLAIIARRPGGVRVLDRDSAFRMVCNLNRYEFVYMKNPMLTAYSYFNRELDIQALVNKEREILQKMVDNTTCLLVQSEDPTKFSSLILDWIAK